MVEGGARGLLPDNSAGRKQELSCNEGTRAAKQPPSPPLLKTLALTVLWLTPLPPLPHFRLFLLHRRRTPAKKKTPTLFHFHSLRAQQESGLEFESMFFSVGLLALSLSLSLVDVLLARRLFLTIRVVRIRQTLNSSTVLDFFFKKR